MPQGGLTPQEFTVNVEPQGLAQGSYSCTITVSAAALNSPQEVVVVLEVTEEQQPPPVEPALPVECVGATSSRLVVRYGYPGLKRDETCRVELSDSPGWTCGEQSRVIQAATKAAGTPGTRRVIFRMRPIERLSAERVLLEYGYGPEMGSVIVGWCSLGGCQATVEVEGDRLVYFRYVYTDGQGAELARSGRQVVAVP